MENEYKSSYHNELFKRRSRYILVFTILALIFVFVTVLNSHFFSLYLIILTRLLCFCANLTVHLQMNFNFL